MGNKRVKPPTDSSPKFYCGLYHKLTNTSAEFYELVGPLLSRREIVKELGFPIWDEPGKIWFVVVDKGQVIAMSAIRVENGEKAVLCSAYVKPEHRRQGLYRMLTEARIAWIQQQPLHRVVATATASSLPLLTSMGFTTTRIAGKYTHVQKEV